MSKWVDAVLRGDHSAAKDIANQMSSPPVLSGDISTVSRWLREKRRGLTRDRKSTRLNSSHGYISYAVFCLKKKKHNPAQLATRYCLRSSATTTVPPSHVRLCPDL